jgi:AAA+ superfamily predicted ATPase
LPRIQFGDREAFPTINRHDKLTFMAINDTFHDLKVLLKSRHGLIHIQTIETERVRALLRETAQQLDLPLFFWSSTKGLWRDKFENSIYETKTVGKALAYVQSGKMGALYFFDGFSAYLNDALTLQTLKDTVEQLAERQGAVIFCGPPDAVPETIKSLYASLTLPLPSLEDIRSMVSDTLKRLSSRLPIKVELTREQGHQLIQSLSGLSLLEAEKLLTRAVVDDNRLSMDDLPKIILNKKQLISQDGLLEYYPSAESMADIADLKGLKEWLSKRKQIIEQPQQARSFGLSFPRGLLLLGVQGCGKSYCAKAISKEWGLPLLKMDPSNLYSKWAGESEQNFKKAMSMAEALAPAVLWIDELEKAFSVSSGDTDSGVSQRIFGTFLAWLQDRKADVFIVATANNIDLLPPEFLRKGRFDEIFFVDLPDLETRRAVFEIHLRRRKRDPSTFDLNALAAACDGFSPAEIEQAIVSALYSAFASKTDVSTESLLAEITSTRPLSYTMREKIEALRAWARERTVAAN